MSEKSFDAKERLMNLKGKSYLQVADRVLWLRTDYPISTGWGIRTRKVDGGLKEGFAEFYCEIVDPEGRVVATGSNVEDKAGFGDFLMKAETGAIGRALAAAGYGTMAAMEEGEVVDAPIQRQQQQQQRSRAAAPEPELEPVAYTCHQCGEPIEAKDRYSAGEIAQHSIERWGSPLCLEHRREMAAIEKAASKVPAGQVSGD